MSGTSTVARRGPSRWQRLADRMLRRMVRRGKGPAFLRVLTVRGRVSGLPRSTPVAPVLDGATAWLVSPYGAVAGVANLRAAGRVDLERGGEATTYVARELDVDAAVPVIRAYLAMPSARFVRRDFDVTSESSDAAIRDEAPRHPVFELTAVG